MELRFRNSFFRDLDSVSNRELNKAISSLIERIEKSRDTTGVPGLKKLKHTRSFEYKIELRVQSKIYWILTDFYGERFDFIRIKSEAWCKKNL